MKKKTLALVLALTLLVAGVVGGTLAWLTDQTAEVKNTFTVGDINIGLTETTTDYKMVPGNTIAKDPTVTVKANSEACWLFVKVTESTNLRTSSTYATQRVGRSCKTAFTIVRSLPPTLTRPSPC